MQYYDAPVRPCVSCISRSTAILQKFYVTQFRRDLLAICGIQSRRPTVFCCFGSPCPFFFPDFTPCVTGVFFDSLHKNRTASSRSMQHDFVEIKRRSIVSNWIFERENPAKFLVHFDIFQCRMFVLNLIALSFAPINCNYCYSRFQRVIEILHPFSARVSVITLRIFSLGIFSRIFLIIYNVR